MRYVLYCILLSLTGHAWFSINPVVILIILAFNVYSFYEYNNNFNLSTYTRILLMYLLNFANIFMRLDRATTFDNLFKVLIITRILIRSVQFRSLIHLQYYLHARFLTTIRYRYHLGNRRKPYTIRLLFTA